MENSRCEVGGRISRPGWLKDWRWRMMAVEMKTKNQGDVQISYLKV